MGRTISDQDNAITRPVAVINEAFARKFFPGQNRLGSTSVLLPTRTQDCMQASMKLSACPRICTTSQL